MKKLMQLQRPNQTYSQRFRFAAASTKQMETVRKEEITVSENPITKKLKNDVLEGTLQNIYAVINKCLC